MPCSCMCVCVMQVAKLDVCGHGPVTREQQHRLMDSLAALLKQRVGSVADTAKLFNLIWGCDKTQYWESLLTQLVDRILAENAGLLHQGNGQDMATLLGLLV